MLALNHLWDLKLSQLQLQTLGAQLGADVPVFVGAHTAWAEGIGEILTPIELPERWYLILVPDCHVSTAEIFSHEQLTRNTIPIKMAAFFDEGLSERFPTTCQAPLPRRSIRRWKCWEIWGTQR